MLPGQVVMGGEVHVLIAILASKHLETHRSAVVPPIRHESLLPALQKPLLAVAPAPVIARPSIVPFGVEKLIRVVEHPEIERKLPSCEHVPVVRVAARA